LGEAADEVERLKEFSFPTNSIFRSKLNSPEAKNLPARILFKMVTMSIYNCNYHLAFYLLSYVLELEEWFVCLKTSFRDELSSVPHPLRRIQEFLGDATGSGILELEENFAESSLRVFALGRQYLQTWFN
jgi:hypothetical protein